MSSAPRAFNSYDAMKLLALLTMTIDHLGYYFWPEVMALRVVGRMAAPMFCFLVGYNRQYAFRVELLVMAAAVATADALLVPHWHPLTILWTILLMRMLLARIPAMPKTAALVGMVTASLAWLPASSVFVQYGTAALLCGIWGKLVAEGHPARGWFGVASLGAMLISNALFFGWATMLLVAFALVMAAVWLLLRDFELKPVAVTWRWPLWLSRHALSYYAVHRLVFSGIAALIRAGA